MDLIRTAKTIDFITRQYNELGFTFSVKHGTYTTVINGPYGDQKFLTHKFGNKVFAAAGMIKRDVLQSNKAKEIMAGNYKKDNYSNNSKIDNLFVPKANNLDINSAYATCLYTNDLNSKKTYDYLKTLKKTERLPCVGMLARSNVTFEYSQGVCTKIEPFREKTCQVFYYLISEVNYLMNDVEQELGQDFFFYWVDGVFYHPQTPPKKEKIIKEMILELGYGFKEEDVRDLSYRRVGDKYIVEMTKNKDHKRYEFQDSKIGHGITKDLYTYAQQTRRAAGIA